MPNSLESPEDQLAIPWPEPPSVIEEVKNFLIELRGELPDLFPARKKARGRQIPFQGAEIELRIEADPGCARSELREEAGAVVITRSPNDETRPLELLNRWYHEKARRLFSERAGHFAPLMGVRYNRIQIKDQRTLWGSCSREGNLNFNWRVIMAPPAVLDYLVIHELAHLHEMNHSRRFWSHVAAQCPAWREHRKWLREHSGDLKSRLRRRV